MDSNPEKNSNPDSIKSGSIAIRLIVIGLLLALVGIWLMYVYESSLFLSIALFVFSVIVFIRAAFDLKTNPIIMFGLVGLCTTFLSFAYQPIGPVIRQHGTECIPLEDCFAPVRGGGFPMQFVVDNPGVSIPDLLGIEDEFRLWAFVLDVIFYFVLGQLLYKFIRSIRARKRNPF
jgi:hypothetical protein